MRTTIEFAIHPMADSIYRELGQWYFTQPNSSPDVLVSQEVCNELIVAVIKDYVEGPVNGDNSYYLYNAVKTHIPSLLADAVDSNDFLPNVHTGPLLAISMLVIGKFISKIKKGMIVEDYITNGVMTKITLTQKELIS